MVFWSLFRCFVYFCFNTFRFNCSSIRKCAIHDMRPFWQRLLRSMNSIYVRFCPLIEDKQNYIVYVNSTYHLFGFRLPVHLYYSQHLIYSNAGTIFLASLYSTWSEFCLLRVTKQQSRNSKSISSQNWLHRGGSLIEASQFVKRIAVCLTESANHYSTATGMDTTEILLNEHFDTTEFKVVVKRLDTCQTITDNIVQKFMSISSSFSKQ